jgi:hypothetical protein
MTGNEDLCVLAQAFHRSPSVESKLHVKQASAFRKQGKAVR